MSASCRRRDSTPTSCRPGWSTCRCNGGFGLEVGGDAGALRALAARLPSTGVTTFLPTAVSSGAGGLPRRSAPRSRRRAATPGARMPGPAPGRAAAGAGAGGRPPRGRDRRRGRRRSTTCSTTCWRRAPSALVTLAPERPGALALIRPAARGGRRRQPRPHRRDASSRRSPAIDAGATLVTHLLQRDVAASPPRARRGRRRAGRRSVTVMLIADGVHVHPAGAERRAAQQGARARRAGHRRDRRGRRAARPLRAGGRRGDLRRRRARGSPTGRWPARR